MKKFLFFAAAMLCLVACNKNNENNPTDPARKVILHATVENGGAANGPHRVAPVDPTAATVNFTWEAGDQVTVKTDAGSYTLDATNINGNLADFEGEVAGDLATYSVYYGYDPDAASQTIEYVAGSFKPCVYGEGHNDNFTLNQFFPVLKLQLKGAVTLGKIEYLIGTDVKATMTITDGIALTSTASVVYLPVADVASTGFSLKFYDNAATPALIMEKSTTFNLADKMGKIVTMPELEVKASLVLPGEFSVSATKKVHFSKGNLWADGDNALHFEDAQWKSATTSTADHVSHFTWTDNIADATARMNISGDYLFCDESHKVSVDGGEAIYYALSKDEWQYLFNHHNKKWVTVNSVNGYVIAPDGFEGELANSYANDAELVTAGNLVFLPAAGFSFYSEVLDVGTQCGYWSSTADEYEDTYAHYFSEIRPDDSINRYYGYSVRLITDVN